MQKIELYQNTHPEHPGSIGPKRKGLQARYSFVREDGTRGWHDLNRLPEQTQQSLRGQYQK